MSIMLGENFANNALGVGIGPDPTWVKGTHVYVSLHTANLAAGYDGSGAAYTGANDFLETEVVAADYMRQAVLHADVSIVDGIVEFENTLTFTEDALEDWGTIKAVGIWRTATGTDLLDLIVGIRLQTEKVVLTGGEFIINAGFFKWAVNRGNVYGTQPPLY